MNTSTARQPEGDGPALRLEPARPPREQPRHDDGNLNLVLGFVCAVAFLAALYWGGKLVIHLLQRGG